MNAGPGYKGCGGRSLLDAAAEGRDVGLISALLFEKGGMADLNTVSGTKGMSTLLRAICNGHSAAARFLVLHGADATVVDTDGRGALRYAFDYGVEHAVVRDLIIAGAPLCAVDDTPAHPLLLFRAGGSDDDLNAVSGSKGTTALHRAIEDGNSAAARLLVLHGADVRVVDGKQRSALHSALLSNVTVKVVRDVIIAGADLDAKDFNGNAPAYLAISRRIDSFAVLRTLLRRGADVNATNNKDESLVHATAKNGKLEYTDALLDAGANPDSKDINGNTPFHIATRRGDVEFVCKLSNWRVDLEAINNDGWRPIHSARDDLDMIKTLNKHGADVNKRGKYRTALHEASHKDNVGVVDALIDAGADVDARCHPYSRTPLHDAILYKRWGCMEALLRRGANVNARDDIGLTPLATVCRPSSNRVRGRAPLNWKPCSEIGDFLLRRGADETITGKDGKTPKQLAALRTYSYDEDRVDRAKLVRLLDNAPANRAWRRRGMLLMCRARQGRKSTEKPVDNPVSRPRREQETREKDCVLLRVVGLPEDPFRVTVGFL